MLATFCCGSTQQQSHKDSLTKHFLPTQPPVSNTNQYTLAGNILYQLTQY